MKIDDKVSVEFIHIPPYMNVVEYFICIIRQRFLNHLPTGQDIEQTADILTKKVHLKQLLNTNQLNNIIRKATNLDSKKTTSF